VAAPFDVDSFELRLVNNEAGKEKAILISEQTPVLLGSGDHDPDTTRDTACEPLTSSPPRSADGAATQSDASLRGEGCEDDGDSEALTALTRKIGTGFESTVSGRPRLKGLQRADGGVLVALHIYDVWGYSAVKHLNTVVSLLGTGAFHSAVEVFGVEYSYGYKDDPPGASGIFTCEPCKCQAHSYREQVVMGRTEMSELEVESVLEELREEWVGQDYDLLRRNCCHFSDEFCRRLGVGAIPAWVNNLAAAGASLGNGFRQLTKPKDRQRHSQRIIEAAKKGRFDKRYSARVGEGNFRAPGKALLAAMRTGTTGKLIVSWMNEAPRQDEERVVQTPRSQVRCLQCFRGNTKRSAK